MDIRKIRKLIELLQESGIAELEIHEGEESVRISRGGHHAFVANQPVANQPTTTQAPTFIPDTPVTEPPPSATQDDPRLHKVMSPMIGVFYASPSPDQPSFVNIGQQITAGQTLCIIEAMKIMNQIEAPVNGTLTQVLVENGDTIEYNQPLFVIELPE